VTYLKKISISPHLFSFLFCFCFLFKFVFVFPIEIKMRGVYVGGNDRKRECRECFLLLFSTSFNMFFYVFFEREIKRRCVCGSSDGKELEKCRESLFGPDRVRIYTHTLQYQCNLSLNCNEQYKEGIGHDTSKLWGSNRSQTKYKINHHQ